VRRHISRQAYNELAAQLPPLRRPIRRRS
jgi:hypothetical protein